MSFLAPLVFPFAGHEFRTGYYFANSEAGECSVQAAFVISCNDGEYRCLGELHRLAHVGKKFSSRVGALVGRVVRDAEHTSILGMFQNLSQKELDLSKSLTRSMLAANLNRHGIEMPIGELIVSWAAHRGSQEKTMPTKRSEEAANRTGMDLFMRLITEAANYAPKIRETMEQAAFKLLTGEMVV
jgi:hypothetical protein